MTSQSPIEVKEAVSADPPTRLLLAGCTDTDLAGLSSLLQVAGLEPDSPGLRPFKAMPLLVNMADVGELDHLPEWLDRHPDAHLLMVLPIPILDIARRMINGSPPGEALEHWCKSAEELMRLVRRFRRRSSMVFGESVFANSSAFLELLTQRLGLSIAVTSPSSEPTYDLPSAVFRMLAENALWQSSKARSLAAELEATALPLPTPREFLLPAADQVFAEYRDTVDVPKRRAQELRQENDLLLEQLQRVQKKMEAFSVEKQNVEARLSSAEQYRTELDEHRRKLEQVQAQTKDLQEENDLLLTQLHHVQEELEAQFLAGQSSGKELELKRVHAQNLEAQLAIEKSAQEALTADKDRFLAEIHRLQEDLVSQMQRYQKLEAQLNRRVDELEETRTDLTVARSTIEALYSSKSWKITKPMRAFLDLFVGGNKQAPKT